MLLTSKQTSSFWRLWARAEVEQLPSNTSRQDRDAFRHAVLRRVCGVDSLRLVRNSGFDRLMLEVASLAGDYVAMGYWCVASERRTAFMIRECARQIGELANQPHGWEYCRGVFSQAALPSSWMDIPDHLLMSVFQMLDTHRRRVLKRDYGWTGERNNQPLGFCPSRAYRILDGRAEYDDSAVQASA